MKIAIITSRYPSKKSPYNHMFVHIRSIEILQQGENVTVFVPTSKKSEYIHEGVTVRKMASLDIVNELKTYDILYLHLLNIYPFNSANGWPIYKYVIKNNVPYAMYVHGSEVQKYGARMFEFNYKLTDFLKWFKKDVLVIPKMRKFVKQTQNRKNTSYIYPSKWMHNEMEDNLGVKINNFHIIPNGIDVKLFKYHETYDKKYKLLTLRPLSSKKYAVDIAIEVMKFLPEKYTLEIFGKGHYKKQYLKQINNLNLNKRVLIKNAFIDRKELNLFFSKYGVFLAPTRMDAQGVSMCEAMASGLLTVSNSNTAIPEFIQNFENGVLGKNGKEIAEHIEKVTNDKEKFYYITNAGRKSMEAIDIKLMVAKEINILKKLIVNNV